LISTFASAWLALTGKDELYGLAIGGLLSLFHNILLGHIAIAALEVV
jgi:hypothetical protein